MAEQKKKKDANLKKKVSELKNFLLSGEMGEGWVGNPSSCLQEFLLTVVLPAWLLLNRYNP